MRREILDAADWLDEDNTVDLLERDFNDELSEDVTVIWVTDNDEVFIRGRHNDKLNAVPAFIVLVADGTVSVDDVRGIKINLNKHDKTWVVVAEAAEHMGFDVNSMYNEEYICRAIVVDCSELKKDSKITDDLIRMQEEFDGTRLGDMSGVIYWGELSEMGLSVAWIDPYNDLKIQGVFTSSHSIAGIDKFHIENGKLVPLDGPNALYLRGFNIEKASFKHIPFNIKEGNYYRRGILFHKSALDNPCAEVIVGVAATEISFDELTPSFEGEVLTLVNEMIQLRLHEVKVLYEYKGEITNQAKWDEEMDRINKLRELLRI